jgi:hypothetical protein
VKLGRRDLPWLRKEPVSWWKGMAEEASGKEDRGTNWGILEMGRRTRSAAELLIGRWSFDCLSYSAPISKSLKFSCH